MPNLRYTLLTLCRKYLIKGIKRNENYGLLYAIADAIAGNEIKLIKQLTCPFCGRKFSTRAALAAHLTHTSWKPMWVPSYGVDYPPARDIYPTNPCPFNFLMLIREIIDTYINIRQSIDQRPKRVYVWFRDGKKKFRNRKELAEYIRKHPEVIVR